MIICCGEALIDMLPRRLGDGSDVFLPVSGGAVFNTAIALGRLGGKAGFVSGISTDMFGEQLIASLEGSGVSTNYCMRSGRNSTLAFVKLTNGQASYSFFDENSAGRMLEIRRSASSCQMKLQRCILVRSASFQSLAVLPMRH